MTLKATRQERGNEREKKSKISSFIFLNRQSVPYRRVGVDLRVTNFHRNFLEIGIWDCILRNKIKISQVQITEEFLTFFLSRSLEDMINLLAELIVCFKFSSTNNYMLRDWYNWDNTNNVNMYYKETYLKREHRKFKAGLSKVVPLALWLSFHCFLLLRIFK